MPIVEIQRVAGIPKERVDLEIGSFFATGSIVRDFTPIL